MSSPLMSLSDIEEAGSNCYVDIEWVLLRAADKKGLVKPGHSQCPVALDQGGVRPLTWCLPHKALGSLERAE